MEEKEEEEKVKRRKRKEEELAEERSREVYRSLTKKGPWAEHLTSLPKRGVGDLSTVPHLTTKERPHHVYSDSKPSKQIIAHKITYNGITSGFEVKS